MTAETISTIFFIGLGIGTLFAGIVAGLNQRKMKGTINQHIETTTSELETLRKTIDQKNEKLIEIQLEARYNAGKYDASIALVAQAQKDIVELRQHEADLARMLKQAYAQIATMKAAQATERTNYEKTISELKRRIGELEVEREANRNEISKLSQMLTNAIMKGVAPKATPAPKPSGKPKLRSTAKAAV